METESRGNWQDSIIRFMRAGRSASQAAHLTGVSYTFLSKALTKDKEFKARVDAEIAYSASMVLV